jgi:hypothetical protein
MALTNSTGLQRFSIIDIALPTGANTSAPGDNLFEAVATQVSDASAAATMTERAGHQALNPIRTVTKFGDVMCRSVLNRLISKGFHESSSSKTAATRSNACAGECAIDNGRNSPN